jgi:hypothetical protein
MLNVVDRLNGDCWFHEKVWFVGFDLFPFIWVFFIVHFSIYFIVVFISSDTSYFSECLLSVVDRLIGRLCIS